jgi:hypothetical protein
MLRIHWLLGLMAWAGLSAACNGTEQTAEWPHTPLVVVQRKPSPTAPAATPAALPTAIRLLSVAPEDVVVKPGDLPPGFRVTAEFPTTSILLTAPAWFRSKRGLPIAGPVGHHVVLVRETHAVADGVVSVATTVVRYETTAGAQSAFARVSAPTPVSRVDETALAFDESRAVHYRVGPAVVDEVLLRARNYLLGLTLVRSTIQDETKHVKHYVDVLRAKLPE